MADSTADYGSSHLEEPRERRTGEQRRVGGHELQRGTDGGSALLQNGRLKPATRARRESAARATGISGKWTDVEIVQSIKTAHR